MKEKKSVIIIGATSGIGKSLAFEFFNKGWKVGITGRREALLASMKQQVPDFYCSCFDITQTQSEEALRILANEMGHVDMIVINSGVGNFNPNWKTELDLQTIETNVTGFTRMAMTSLQIFIQQGNGHLVGISSVAGHFGFGKAAAYNASKAFVSRYLSGLCHRLKRTSVSIYITDCQPGFIETPMIAGKKEPFGVISSEEFARQFVSAIQSRPRTLILPRRWIVAVWLAKLLPDSIIQKVV